jgi:acetate kinase
VLNKRSGLLGVCGHSDLRAIIDKQVRVCAPAPPAARNTHAAWQALGVPRRLAL